MAITASVYAPFVWALKDAVPPPLRRARYPPQWTFDRHVERVVRECLLSEYLGLEMAELFRGQPLQQLDALAASFKFENCVQRTELNEILKADVEASRAAAAGGETRGFGDGGIRRKEREEQELLRDAEPSARL